MRGLLSRVPGRSGLTVSSVPNRDLGAQSLSPKGRHPSLGRGHGEGAELSGVGAPPSLLRFPAPLPVVRRAAILPLVGRFVRTAALDVRPLPGTAEEAPA